MAANGQTPWHIKGDELANCNCNWACPCQFDSDPTEGNCRALVTYQVTEGKFGDIAMDGVRWAVAVSWPGAIHEGDGTIQLVIDEEADDEQREAVMEMASGEHGGTYFEIFSSVLPHVREPVSAPIEFDVDRDERRGSVRVGEIGEMKVEPIKNPVTGDEHRVRIDLPDGFEYTQAEIANTVQGRVSGEDPLSFELSGTYAQLNEFDWSNA